MVRSRPGRKATASKERLLRGARVGKTILGSGACVCVRVRVGWGVWSELVDGAGAWGWGARTLIGIWRPWRSRGSGCEMSAAHHFHWMAFGFRGLGLDSRARCVEAQTQGVPDLGVTDLGSKASRFDVKPH